MEKEETLKANPAEVVSPESAPPAEYPEANAMTPFEGDFMEVTIEVAQHVDKYEKALNTIMNFIVKRTYAGDWISHDKAGTPIEDRTANPSGAAMERVARDLGIQEMNRTKPIKKFHGEDHPGHYFYECEGDFEFRGRRIHAIGMASTLNPFYYKSGGNEKKPSDIREEYIIRDCLRDCIKQGVKGMFGLRKIPVMMLKELGYDITKIKYVNYQAGEKSATTTKPEATAKPTENKETFQASFLISVLSPRTYGTSEIIDIITDNKEKYSWWGKSLTKSEEGKQLEEWRKNEYLVTVNYSMKGQYKNIESVVSGVPQ